MLSLKVFEDTKFQDCSVLDNLEFCSAKAFTKFPDITKPTNEKALLGWIDNNVSKFEKAYRDDVIVQQMTVLRSKLFAMKSYAELDENDKTIYFSLCLSLFTMIGCCDGWWKMKIG